MTIKSHSLRILGFCTPLGLAASLFLAGCGDGSGGGGGGAGDTIKVGEFASLTGKEATFGQSSHNGTQIAVDEINAAGGLAGKKIKLLTEDTQSKAGESQTVVNKLVSRDGVIAVLGEVASSRSMEAAPVCQAAKIPMISPSSTNPKVTETGDYIFRVCFIDPFQGTVMANFAAKDLKAKRVAVFTDAKSDYSKGLAKFFKEQHLKNGGEIVAELDFNGGDSDFNAQLTTIKAAKPEAIFLPGYYTDAAVICIQAKQLGITVPLFGGDGWESEKLVEIGKDAVEGQYFSTHYHPDVGSDKSRQFVAAYKRAYGSAPDAMAALGYDSMMVLADAIKRCGSTDSTKIRDALAATKDYDAVTGKITINAQRDATKAAVIIKVEKGEFKYVETIAP
ncbi:MAG TPA: ABC transporter substrate-binding protein [Candidatus Limnocylindria bacterium]|jgi:branched-chain amino acid transport system substrate-binding protein|nr:ABC transporter substrate-binding protein [Candidatus Limnocylindria bacterium]